MDEGIFRPKELTAFDEHAPFPAENYHSEEFLQAKMEVYSPPEIRDNAQSRKERRSRQAAHKTPKGRSGASEGAAASSSTAVTVSTSAIAPIVLVGAVGGAIVFGFTETKEPVPPESVPAVAAPAYGDIAYSHCRLDSFFDPGDENASGTVEVAICFEGTLNEGYSCRVMNLSSRIAVELAPDAGEVVFEGLEPTDATFVVSYLKGDKVLAEEEAVFEYEALYEEAEEFFKLTYNLDGTSNFYYFAGTSADESLHIVFEVDELIDEPTGPTARRRESADGSTLVYETAAEGRQAYVPGIPFESYRVSAKVYGEIDGNLYGIYESLEGIYVSPDNYWVDASVLDNRLTIGFVDEFRGEMSVIITYDDGANETFKIEDGQAPDADGTYAFDLNRVPGDAVDVAVEGYFKGFSNDEEGLIAGWVGDEYCWVRNEWTVYVCLSDRVVLDRIEVYDTEVAAAGTYRILVYENSYVNAFSRLEAELLDESGEVLVTAGEINGTIQPGEFESLDKTSAYRLRLTITDGNGLVTSQESYDIVYDEPTDIDQAANDFTAPNPSDYALTLNEDGSFNAYARVRSSDAILDERLYIRGILTDTDVNWPVYSSCTNESILAFEDMYVEYFSVSYDYFLRNGELYYHFGESLAPSGTLGGRLDDGQRLIADDQIDVFYLQDTGADRIVSLYFRHEIVSDVEIEAKSESGESVFSGTVTLAEIRQNENSVRLDVTSQATGSYLQATLVGTMAYQAGAYGDITSSIEMKGGTAWPFVCTTNIEIY